ncbi:MAG: hypothetical protein AB1Z98_37580 [Nannocystaceae bacterium]
MRRLVLVTGRLGLVALLPTLACRVGPSQAPEPNAAAWNEPAPLPRGSLDADGSPEGPEPAVDPQPPPRPRPPHTIFRDEVERATGRGPAYLLRQLGPEPFRHEGHFVGWRITRLFPDDPSLCAIVCDLALDDVILSVNGMTLQTPQQLSDALRALPGWQTLEIHSLRGGQRRVVRYPIVDAPQP